MRAGEACRIELFLGNEVELDEIDGYDGMKLKREVRVHDKE